jgi:hypothetical protein
VLDLVHRHPRFLDGGEIAMSRVVRGVGRRRAVVAAVASGGLVASGALVSSAPASLAAADHSAGGSVRTVVSGLVGPRGLSARHGKVVVAETDGTVSRIYYPKGSSQAALKRLGRVRTSFPPAVSVGPHGTVWVLTGAGPGKTAAKLFKWRKGYAHPKVVANIAAYQKKDPDPFDLEDAPRDSNPFGVAALDDGTVLVADAGGNDLLRVWPGGHINTVARLKPRTVKVPKGLPRTVPGEDGEPPLKIPPAGTKVRSEAVATSVTVGADGYWYVGELRGFPATPGKSQIWRIRPGSTGAVCNPARPHKGACTRFADGLTSIMALDGAPGGSVYAVEMSKKSWLKVELQKPGSRVGALIRVSPSGGLRELAPGALKLPGGVAALSAGKVLVAGPIFGPGKVVRVSGQG